MPEWVHNRAEHLLARNPSMPKSMAFAIATQQGEATGHTPKGFGTPEGNRIAKAKFNSPKDDVQTANPGKLSSPKLAGAGFTHTVSVKTTASGAGSLRDILKNISQNGSGGHTFGIVTTDKPARHIGSWDGADAMTEAAMRTAKQASVGEVALLVLRATGMLEKLGFANSAYAGQPAQNGPGMKGHSQLPAFVPPPLEVKEAARVGVLRRIGEYATGSRHDALREAALRHGSAAVAAAQKVDRTQVASHLVNRLKQHGVQQGPGAIHPDDVLHHFKKVTDKAVGTFAHERKAARHLADYAMKEHTKRELALSAAALTPAIAMAAIAKGNLAKAGKKKEAGKGIDAGMKSRRQTPPIVIKEADWKRLFKGPSEEELKEREYKSKQRALGTLAATGGVGSVVAAKESLPRLLGSQVLYHGTDSQAAKSIAHSGLDPSLGGTGGAVAEGFSGFVEDSLGKIHASTDKGEARSFAGRLAAHRKGKSSDLAALGSSLLHIDPKGGKTIAIGVPYSDFVNKFEVDNTMPSIGMTPTAYRSSHAVPASRVSGSGSFLSAAFKGRPDSYLSYAKQYPKRLANGVGLAAAAPVLAYGGLSNRDRHKLELTNRKEAGVGVGAGMSTSQYSGPLSYGPFKQTSQIPGFVSPGMTKVDPSLEPGGVKAAAAATGAMSPAAKLSTSQRVGAPKTTGFSGPSIADIAKPKGYGTPLAGAGKNAI